MTTIEERAKWPKNARKLYDKLSYLSGVYFDEYTMMNEASANYLITLGKCSGVFEAMEVLIEMNNPKTVEK